MQKKRIAIFASGTGSNAVNLIRTFEKDQQLEVAFVLSNNANARVLNSAKALGVKNVYFSNDDVANGSFITNFCKKENIDWIVLAGYLRLIPIELIQAFNHRIINLHPSLLPKYGGKGMYGQFVHKAVIENKESESGITIHFVNEAFDEGEIIAQFHCPIDANDDIQAVESKIRYLEQTYLPAVVRGTILTQ